MKIVTPTIVPFGCTATSSARRALRKIYLSAIRSAESPVIVDFSGCRTLNHQDIQILLECVAQIEGRDTQLLFVAGSDPIRVLLEVTRLAALVPVFSSMEEALAPRQLATENYAEILQASQSPQTFSA